MLEHGFPDPTFRAADSVGQVWDPVVGISGKIPGDATDLGTTLGEPAVYPGFMDPYIFNSSQTALPMNEVERSLIYFTSYTIYTNNSKKGQKKKLHSSWNRWTTCSCFR